VWQPRALERVHGILGRADERLAVQVERRVEHGADARAGLELAATISSRRFGLVGNASIMYGEASPFGLTR